MPAPDDATRIEELIASLVERDPRESQGMLTERLTFESEGGRVDLIPDHDAAILHLESVLLQAVSLPRDNRLQQLVQAISQEDIAIALNPEDQLVLYRRLELKGLDAGTLSDIMASLLDFSSVAREALLRSPGAESPSEAQEHGNTPWIPA